MELMASATNLPDETPFKKCNSFAAIWIDVNAMDDHDREEIGGLQEDLRTRYEDLGE